LNFEKKIKSRTKGYLISIFPRNQNQRFKKIQITVQHWTVTIHTTASWFFKNLRFFEAFKRHHLWRLCFFENSGSLQINGIAGPLILKIFKKKTFGSLILRFFKEKPEPHVL
jgi:hypothetical protein